MREIKFRGRCGTKRWYYGDLRVLNLGLYIAPQNINFDDIYHPVEPNTVGQYTGIKDKNDVMIFEGDILINKREKKKYIVRFCWGEYLLDATGDDCPCVMRQNGIVARENTYYLKVIGNIHDNPELTAGKNSEEKTQ
jgi:hypothetical protein